MSSVLRGFGCFSEEQIRKKIISFCVLLLLKIYTQNPLVYYFGALNLLVYCMKSVEALFSDLTYLPVEVILFMIMHFPIEY